MLHILHAGDFHLDTPFAGLSGEQAAQRRKEQRQLLELLLEEAEGADLCLFSGDLLDSRFCYRETAEALESFFEKLPCPAFLSPGNHDFYSPESPWRRMRLPERVHLFRSGVPEPWVLPQLGCTVWGAAFQERQSRPLLRGFSAPRDGGLQLMVLHGKVNDPGSVYNPITEQEIRDSGLHYLALGHVHTRSELRKSGDTYWQYPGCLMGRGFDETGDKGCLHVWLDEEGCRTEFQSLPSRRYWELRVELTGEREPLTAVTEALPEDCEGDILRMTLCGEAEKPDMEALRSALQRRCFALTLADETKAPAQLWAGAEEDTLRGGFLRLMRERYELAADPAQRERLLLAVRFGLAALENREAL